MKYSLLFILCFNSFAFASEGGSNYPPIFSKSIYGEDNRVETSLYPDAEVQQLAKSVAGQVHYKALSPDPRDPSMYNFDRYILSEEFSLCPDQNFETENMLMGCSGVLIGDDLILTANHCVSEQIDCDELRWVFDFTDESEQIPESNIYSCKNIVAGKYENTSTKKLDYSIIQLDRPVVGRTPLKYRQSGKILPGEEVLIIGHPSGLPQKIADHAKVALLTKSDIPKTAKEFMQALFHDFYVFKTNLDAFEGNSGSPVINKKTKLVEGILTNGGEDFEMVDYNGDGSYFCRKEVHQKESLWYAEEVVQRVTSIKELYK